ncbi:MAG: hypothetical protein AAGI91_07870 [Bacteroidota bacterium]
MLWLVVIAVLVWIALPFVPAVLEVYRRRDAAPLALSNRYREDLRLREDVAEDEVTVPAGEAVTGTASAGRVLRIGVGCSFERLCAPAVRFGEAVAGGEAVAAARLPFEPPPHADEAAGRFLVRGDLTVPARTLVEADLVVTGALRLEAAAVLRGSAKSHGPMNLGPEVEVQGSLFSKRDLYVGAGSRIAGVAAADGDLVLAQGSVVGTPETGTTATGRRVYASAGSCVHGTVWALEAGRVTAAQRRHV